MLRLVKVEDLLGGRDARLGYRDAVQDYVTAFDVADAEAIRRPRSDFSPQDSSGLRTPEVCCAWRRTARRHRRNAGTAMTARKELDGLIVLPAMRRTSIEAESPARSRP